MAGVGGAVAGTALLGSQDTSSPWYRALSKPAIQPPAIVFPIVWTGLYAAITAAAVATLESADPDEARSYLRASQSPPPPAPAALPDRYTVTG